MTTKTTERTTWHLAHLAGCANPDAHDGRGFSHQRWDRQEGSPGAKFLRAVEDYVYGYDEITVDTASEVADAAVPVYTNEVWSVFVDLAAYQEDPSEFGADASDMEQAAKVCLYIIADRLAWSIIEEDGGDEA